MNEQSTPPAAGSEPPAATPQPAPTVDPTPTTVSEQSRPRLRERAFGLRGVVAVGAATLVLGGLGGTALGFALDSDRGDGPGRSGQPFQMGNGQFGGQFGGGPMGGQFRSGQMGGPMGGQADRPGDCPAVD